MSEQTVAAIADVLKREIGATLKPIEFDINANETSGEIQLVTDAWTLGIESLPDSPSAWVAIDAEPDHPSEYDHAIRASFRPHELTALRRADESLNGLLTQALRAGPDPFSQHFADSLDSDKPPT